MEKTLGTGEKYSISYKEKCLWTIKRVQQAKNHVIQVFKVTFHAALFGNLRQVNDLTFMNCQCAYFNVNTKDEQKMHLREAEKWIVLKFLH